MSTPIAASPTASGRPPLVIVTDDVENAVESAWNVASKPLAQKSKGEKFLDKLGDHALALSDMATGDGASTAKVVVTNLIDGFNIDINSVKDGLKTFQQTTELVMKGLDEVAKIHPFITVAVIAFKAVVTLELKRRENNAKILALHLEMRDTMGMLLQLRTVRDPSITATDGTSIAGRMQEVLKRLAEDIKACGNVCDKYMKKSTIAKVLKAPVYEQRLADCAESFVVRRKELKMAMAIRTTLGVDAANRTLESMQKTMKTTDDKVSMLLVFQKLNSARDRDLMNYIEGNGGPDAFMKNDELLKKLQKKADSMGVSSSLTNSAPQKKGDSSSGTADGSVAEKVQALKKELKEDFDDALSKNMIVFGRKLDVQSQQLSAQMRMESDRVISAFRSGAHEKIIDNNLRRLWQEMGWKGSVKARQLVLCLHEFFCEKHDHMDENHHAHFLAETPIAPSPTVSVRSEGETRDDDWALEFINVVHVPPIVESIDDNVSGFVSIKEANTFALARPPGWSFPHWLAYWAAAWPQSIEMYRQKIYVIVQRMFGMLPEIRLENRHALESYLDFPMNLVEYMLRSVDTSTYASNDSILVQKTKDYVEGEEQRLRETLESIQYNIDALGTVSLVTGPGRIEKFIFPLLYLMLRRHLEIFESAKKSFIAEEDLQIMRSSMNNCLWAVTARIETLTAVFKHSSGEGVSRFGSFAFGMYEAYFKYFLAGDTCDHRLNTFAEYHHDDGWLDEEPRTASQDSGNAGKEQADEAEKKEGGPEQEGITQEQQEEANGAMAVVSENPTTAPRSMEETTAEKEESLGGHATPISAEEVSRTVAETETGEAGGEEENKNTNNIPEVPSFLSPYAHAIPPPSFTPPHDDDTPWPQVAEGTWCGYRTVNESPYKVAGEGLTTLTFDPIVDKVIKGEAFGFYGNSTIAGSIGGDDSDSFTIHFKKTWDDESEYAGISNFFTGKFNPEKETITGTWGNSGDDIVGTFTLSRTPLHLQRYRVQEPTGNIGKDLWTFARDAVLGQVRRNLFTWSYVKGRAEERKTYTRLELKRCRLNLDYAPRVELTEEERHTINILDTRITPRERRFYYSLTDIQIRHWVIHTNAYCDTCGRKLAGTRLACVQCALETYGNQLDLCTNCRDTLPTTSVFSHEEDHDLMLTNTFLQDRDKAYTFNAAKEKAKNVKADFRQKLISPPSPEKLKESGAFGVLCSCCKDPLELPCWACFTCDDFLCDNCALKEEPFQREHRYVRLHRGSVITEDSSISINRIMKLEEHVDGHKKMLEDKLDLFEDKLTNYQSSVEARLTALEEKMESQFASLENILKALFANIDR